MKDMPELTQWLDGSPDAAADIATTEGWLKYWKAQGSMKVYSTAYKNVISNMAEIKEDAGKLATYWDAKDFYDTAIEASTIARIALPVVGYGDGLCDHITTKDIADYIAGFMAGMTGNDHKADMEQCFKDTPAFEADVCNTIKAIQTKDNQQILQALQALLGDLPQLGTWMAGCPNEAADWATLANWYKYWKAQGSMKVYSTAYKNALANMAEIKADAKKITVEYDSGDFYSSAKDAFTIARIALPLPPSTVGGVKEDCLAMLTSQVDADFLAGFVKGFTGNDHKAEMEACYTDTAAFRDDICTASAAFATKDNQQVLSAIQTILGDLPQLKANTASCPADVQTDINVVGNWYKFWKGQGEMKVYQTAYHNLVTNMSTVTTDANQISADVSAGNYEGAAFDAASLAKLALPLPGAEAFLQ